jgi:hypothetical protein
MNGARLLDIYMARQDPQYSDNTTFTTNVSSMKSIRLQWATRRVGLRGESHRFQYENHFKIKRMGKNNIKMNHREVGCED